jgi:hypothetical protein
MYPKELAERESELIVGRRKVVGIEDKAPRIGVACSGGGIRSATVCLGVFQGFAKGGLLPRIDYVSTISGGGYFGSFLGSLYLPRPRDAQVDASQIPGVVSKTLADEQSAPIKWLRKHGRYIAPNGPADYANIVAIYVRNWIGVHYVIGITFLTLFFLLLWTRAFASMHEVPRLQQIADFMPLNWGPFLIIPLLLFLIVSAPLGWAFWLTQYGTNRDGIETNTDVRGARMIQAVFKSNWVLWATLLVLGVCVMRLLSGNGGNVVATVEHWAASSVLLIGVLALIYWASAEVAIVRNSASHGGSELSLRRRHSVRSAVGLARTSLSWFRPSCDRCN